MAVHRTSLVVAVAALRQSTFTHDKVKTKALNQAMKAVTSQIGESLTKNDIWAVRKDFSEVRDVFKGQKSRAFIRKAVMLSTLELEIEQRCRASRTTGSSRSEVTPHRAPRRMGIVGSMAASITSVAQQKTPESSPAGISGIKETRRPLSEVGQPPVKNPHDDGAETTRL